MKKNWRTSACLVLLFGLMGICILPHKQIAAQGTAQPAPFIQLTNGGCCVQPFFHPDSKRVLFLDKPTASASVGLYSVDVAAPSQPQLFVARTGPFNRALSFAADLVNGQTVVEDLRTGKKFGINNGGRSISFSPNNQQIVWTVGQDAGNFDVRRNDIWLANVDGSNAKRIATRYGGGLVAWFADGLRVLISGKTKSSEPAPTLAILNLSNGAITPLFSAERMRGFALSPDNTFVVFFIAQAQDESLDGMYALELKAGAQPKRLNFFGAYKWRDATRLLYIPLKLNQPSHELWQLDVTTGAQTQLIAASTDSPFRVMNGDWDISPDGARIVFVSAKDKNIWVKALG